jgi:hypothetical protein
LATPFQCSGWAFWWLASAIYAVRINVGANNSVITNARNGEYFSTAKKMQQHVRI